ncbi:MAG: ATP-binding cassette subfamily C bacterial LapB [Rhodospirillaceae bacterium]|nr:MAG: ATP-binding cassette subfamily C bacterial LapB [Rhodospirillaceae bacterium]
MLASVAGVMMSAHIFEQSTNVHMQARPVSAGVFANHLKEFETVRDFFTSAVIIALVDLPFILLFLVIIALVGGPVVWVPALAVQLV